MKNRYFKNFENFFYPNHKIKSKKKLKKVKPIENFEESERKEQQKYNQLEDTAKRAAVSHNIQEQPLNDPNGINKS